MPENIIDCYAVVAEVATGIALNLEGSRATNGAPYKIFFSSLEEAKAFADQKIKDHPENECSIWHDKKFVYTARCDYISLKDKKMEKFWWQFW
jgi:hypothetical protein